MDNGSWTETTVQTSKKKEFADAKKRMQSQKIIDPKMSCNSNMLVVLREQYASLHTIP